MILDFRSYKDVSSFETSAYVCRMHVKSEVERGDGVWLLCGPVC